MSLQRQCRFCHAVLTNTFVDLGTSPLANSYISAEHADSMEPFFPLHAFVCESCFLVQLVHDIAPEDIFRDYAYFSSYSDTWLAHSKSYVEAMTNRFHLDEKSLVVEIAGNDGYLLQFFLDKHIPVLNVEPATNVAVEAERKGIPTEKEFFGTALANHLVKNGRKADLLVGNNVLAHVPDIDDFVAGLKILLEPSGIITMEFPHLLKLIEYNQFDTIYHEHYSYLSLLAVNRIFQAHGLKIVDVEELQTHGGSLRIYAAHAAHSIKPIERRVDSMLERELNAGLHRLDTYAAFSEKVKQTKRRILKLFIDIKEQGKTIVGYGAPAKGNTLLNYCGIGTDFLDYTVDRSPHKQGHLLTGTRIPIYHPDKTGETQPDFVFILPWNLRDEIMSQRGRIRDWGGRFIVPIPEPGIIYDFL